MRPGMPLLLQLLRGETLAVAPSAADWRETLQLAALESVLPFCAAAIRRQPLALPEAVSAELAAVDREGAIAAFWWTSELAGILSAFSAKAIPVILLKGPLLAERIYGGIHLRTSRDLDLLVRPRDLKRAGAVLAELGFNAAFRPDDYHESWRRGTTLVELHHNVENPLAFRFDMEGIWRRAAEVDFRGQRVRQLSPEDELLFLCLHGVRHRFERLSHVLDVALAFDRLAPQLQAGAFRARSSAPLRPLLLVGHAMAKKLRPCLSGLPVAASAAETAHLEAAAAARWQALLQAPSAPLDWRAQHRFYLDLESTRRGRLLRAARHLAILSTRLIQADFDFAARYHASRPALVWMMRQLRLLARLSTPPKPTSGS